MIIWKLIGSILVLALVLSMFVIPAFLGKITENSFVLFVLFFGYMALIMFVLREIFPVIFGF